MQILRTPDDRFTDLPDDPFEPRDADVPVDPTDPTEGATLRVHYLDEGPADAALLCCFSDHDPVTRGGEKPFMKLVPGAQGQPHRTIEGGGHFLQEDCGPELARIIDEFIAGRLT